MKERRYGTGRQETHGLCPELMTLLANRQVDGHRMNQCATLGADMHRDLVLRHRLVLPEALVVAVGEVRCTAGESKGSRTQRTLDVMSGPCTTHHYLYWVKSGEWVSQHSREAVSPFGDVGNESVIRRCAGRDCMQMS